MGRPDRAQQTPVNAQRPASAVSSSPIRERLTLRALCGEVCAEKREKRGMPGMVPDFLSKKQKKSRR